MTISSNSGTIRRGINQSTEIQSVMIIGVTRRGRRYAGFNREFQLQRKEVVEAHEVVH